MKIENGTKKHLFIKVRHWEHLKTVPGGGYDKNMKNYENTIGKPMVFDAPKPLKSMEKQIHFLISGHFLKKKIQKRCQRGPQKSFL